MTKAGTTEQFNNYIKESCGSEYTLIGEYKNARTPLEIRHNSCGTLYKVRPDDFKHGKRCPTCSIKLRVAHETKTTAKFKEEVSLLVGNEYEVASEYKRWDIKIRMFHKTCGIYYETQPNSFLQGRRCPNCKYSSGENLIKSYLDEHSLSYDQQVKYDDLYDKRKLSYDFYVPKYNLLIEYQGRQHYKPIKRYGGEEHLKVQQYHDNLKREYASKNGINLLEISYANNTLDKVSKVINQKILAFRKAETS